MKILRHIFKVNAFKISLIITALICLAIYYRFDLPFVESLELKSYDVRFKLRGVKEPSGKVAIVAIDDKSIELIGRWPWPRSAFAELIARLYEAGVKTIGFDLLFTEPDQSPELESIDALIQSFLDLGLLRPNDNSEIFFNELMEAAESADNDAMLAAVTKEVGNVVFSMAFVPSKDEPEGFAPYLLDSAYESFGNEEGLASFDPVSLNGTLLPIPVLGDAAAVLGFVNFIPDIDGAMRRGIVVLEHGGALFAPLGVRIAQNYLNLDNEDIAVHFGKRVEVGPCAIPIDRKGMSYINYYGPNYTIPYYSVVDVLSGEIGPERFEGKIVLVGGAAVGLGDLWPNSFTKSFWGVEKQATIVENILDENFMRRPDRVVYVDIAIIVALGLLLGLVLPVLRQLWTIPFTLLIVVLLCGANQYVFVNHRIWLLFVYPMIEIGLVYSGISAFKYLTEEREKKKIKGAFEQYMNPSVVRRVMEHPELLKLGGEKRELSVLFSDIRGFTSISERMSPEELVHFMNEYLTAMTNIVLENEGTLDKYLGDAIMAIYGAPVTQKDHALRACRTAIKMFEVLYDYREEWSKGGLPTVRIGVGINTGDMIVGNMGSERRFDYTVMGDHVNLGSRLEGITKLYGVKMILSEFTYEKVKDDVICRELDFVRVKGKKEPVGIYELFGGDYFTQGEYRFLAPFKNGLEAYRRKAWDEAIGFFEEVLSIKPEDKPTELFIGRCHAMKSSLPPPDWDGVYVAKEK
ncbi:MAG: adenylate/guanylate cyclase domain-containing protein [Desulfobacterales bacterium]|nr:adenylate/guanylate cyclase domain-containing protein [Desulfobacterales bacterium]